MHTNIKNVFKGMASTAALFLVFVAPAQANYGYETTWGGDCSDREAWTTSTGTHLSNYMTRVSATASSMTVYLEPSYSNTNCDVKLPINYTDFEGIEVGVTSNIQTTPGEEEIQGTLNATGNGQVALTLTGLEPATEYQIRARNIYTKDGGATEYASTAKSHYFSTNTVAVSSPGVTADGQVQWTWPEGPASNVKARITIYKRVGNTLEFQTYGTKYKSSQDSNGRGEYDASSTIEDLNDGDYYALITPSKKSIYDGIDMERYGSQPKLVAFRVVNGSVKTADSRTISVTAAQISNCLAYTGNCTIASSVPVLKNLVKPQQVSSISTVSKKKANWTDAAGASFYKVKVTTKSGKKRFSYSKVSNSVKTFKKKHRKKLVSGKTYKVSVQACNAVGCSAWKTKKFTVK